MPFSFTLHQQLKQFRCGKLAKSLVQSKAIIKKSCASEVVFRVSIRRVSDLLVSLGGQASVRVSIRRVSDLLVSLGVKSDSLSSCDHDPSIIRSHSCRHLSLINSSSHHLWPAQAARLGIRRCSKPVACVGALAPSCRPHTSCLGPRESAFHAATWVAAGFRGQACGCIGVLVAVCAQRSAGPPWVRDGLSHRSW